MSNLTIIYAVPWIEVEYGWGSRSEGYKLFTDLQKCCESTKQSSLDGNYEDGYFGPERPLHYFEVPYDSLEDELKTKLDTDNIVWTSNTYKFKFKSENVCINDK